MKIAIIANQGGSGGLIAYINGILSVKTEHTVKLYCTEKLQINECAGNVNIIRTEYAKESGKEILLDKPLNAELVKMVDDFCPDIVMFACGWIRKGLEKYPNVMVLHNQLYIDNAAFIKTVTLRNVAELIGFRISVRRSMKKSDGVIFLSERSKSDTKKSRVKYKKGKVVYFGLDSDVYNDKQENKKANDKIELLYVSSFHKYKNHESLFGAVSILKNKGYDVSLNLIGGSPQERDEELYRLAENLGLENDIKFSGWKTHKEIFEAMDNSDIFVYPSTVESTGLGVMEAMARGMCVASSNMSCMPEVLKDAGVYFNPNNAEDMAKTLEKLINDPMRREELRKKAFEYSKQYTWENAVKEHCGFFEELRRNI